MIPNIDRVPTYIGRVEMTPVEGKPGFFDMTRADEPTENGMALNKAKFDEFLAGSGELVDEFGLTPGKTVAPFHSAMGAFLDFDNGLTPTVGSFSPTESGTTQIAGAYGYGRQGTSTTSRINLNAKVIPPGAKTVRFRAKPIGALSGSQYILDESGSTASNSGMRFYKSGQHLQIGIFNGSGVASFIFTVNNVFTVLDTWYDIAFTWDGTTDNGGIRVYVDSVLRLQTTSTIEQNLPASLNTVLLNGAYAGGSQGGTSIAIDEFETYSQALSDGGLGGLTLTQPGFQLRDGALVRVKSPKNTPIGGTRFRINDGELYAVTGAGFTAGQWRDLVFSYNTGKWSDVSPVPIKVGLTSVPGMTEATATTVNLGARPIGLDIAVRSTSGTQSVLGTGVAPYLYLNSYMNFIAAPLVGGNGFSFWIQATDTGFNIYGQTSGGATMGTAYQVEYRAIMATM